MSKKEGKMKLMLMKGVRKGAGRLVGLERLLVIGESRGNRKFKNRVVKNGRVKRLCSREGEADRCE